WRMRGIIPVRRKPAWGRLSLRRGNEHFSKRTEPGGVVSLRIRGYTAVDRRAVRSGDCRVGGAGHRGLFDADTHWPRPCQAAGSEQDSYGTAGPGEFAHRRVEEPDGIYDAESRIDAVRVGTGQKPRRIHPQGTTSFGPEAVDAARAGTE